MNDTRDCGEKTGAWEREMSPFALNFSLLFPLSPFPASAAVRCAIERRAREHRMLLVE